MLHGHTDQPILDYSPSLGDCIYDPIECHLWVIYSILYDKKGAPRTALVIECDTHEQGRMQFTEKEFARWDQCILHAKSEVF